METLSPKLKFSSHLIEGWILEGFLFFSIIILDSCFFPPDKRPYTVKIPNLTWQINISIQSQEEHLADFKILLFSDRCKLFETIRNCDKNLMFMILYSCNLMQNGGISELIACVKQGICSHCNIKRQVCNIWVLCWYLQHVFTHLLCHFCSVKPVWLLVNEDFS